MRRWYVHPAINTPLRRHVYAGRLDTPPVTASCLLATGEGGDVLDREAGIAYLPVVHDRNQQSSEEEVAAIVSAVASLTGRPLTCNDGTTRAVTLDDMLFVAPYNAQVALLKAALGLGAKVGSVDKFQGQEAPIAFVSLCSSDETALPRGLSFLFDRNRLNVAVSRAQTLCVLVGHPQLAVTPVATLANLKRVNFVAALLAAGGDARGA